MTKKKPNLIHACRTRNVPIFLVKARLSEKSLRRYARFRIFSVTCLNELSVIAAHFFFQAEDGIRDHCVTGVQTVCSSDLTGGRPAGRRPAPPWRDPRCDPCPPARR